MIQPLLPCPFCGGSALIEQYGDVRQSTIYRCDNCSCSLETGEEWDHGRLWNARAALSSHTSALAERDAEIARLQKAHGGWEPIATCPYREPVDLWCVYGGEEYAQYDGGASIGQLVSNRFRTQEYGFLGNQSNDGVPRRDGPDLVPVAWRPSVPTCPAELIAELMGIPLTLEDARAALKENADPHAEAKAYLASRPDHAPTQTEIDDDESCGGFV